MKHIHRFRRMKLGKDKKYYVLKCQLCTSYYADETSIGVQSACNFCDNVFTMNKALLFNSKQEIKETPHCGCKNRKKRVVETAVIANSSSPKLQTLDELLQEISKK